MRDMTNAQGGDARRTDQSQVRILEELLSIETTDRGHALVRMSQLLAEAFGADKVDISLYEAGIESLVALGTSDTPMGRRERELGMDRLPVANDGREVRVYQTGIPYLTGHADKEPDELVGLTQGLGIRSSMVVPLDVAGERRGVILASAAMPDKFSAQDQALFEAVARWVGVVIHRAELVEQVRRQEREQSHRAAADELVTVVAHDLRNYLTPLKARIDLMYLRARKSRRAADIEDAQVVSREIRRLSGFISNLLDVSRIEQGMFTLSLQPAELMALVQDTAEALSTPRTPIEVRLPERISEMIVNVDPERIRQALENLLANALRFSPPGTPVIVSLGAHCDAGGNVLPQAEELNRVVEGAPWVAIVVSDQGPGIPEDVLPRLFTRFVPGSGSPGLGIGLYIANEIARAHGGRLAVDSTPGQGTRFFLMLPLERALP